MKITVNGELIELPFYNSPTLTDIINELGHNSLLIVVEHNGIISQPDNWSSSLVKDGDILEIVTIVGGGS